MREIARMWVKISTFIGFLFEAQIKTYEYGIILIENRNLILLIEYQLKRLGNCKFFDKWNERNRPEIAKTVHDQDTTTHDRLL